MRRLAPVYAIATLVAFACLSSRAGAQQATAVRAARPPVIDGKDDDAVWQTAPATRAFRQYEPGEDLPPTFQTEFRVAYDDRNLYVLVRAFDPHPDSIVRILSRRDVKTNSDQLGIIVDGFYDHRNGNQFAVNPSGVKRDAAHHSDTVEDFSWDGVWDVGVNVDEKGWVAEFMIPFSQLRFGAGEDHTFGLIVAREIARLNERVAWPVFRKSVGRTISQAGTLTGVRGIPAAQRVEVLPYAVVKSVPTLSAPGKANHSDAAVGLDAKAGIGSNLTLDATINPDFGQVESDPSVLNLTAFEIRFDEKRTFFQEGNGLFRCGGPCDGPFYTRRIGRTPQLRASADDPAFTTILGAAKLTGRFSNGFTVAALDAITSREVGAAGTTIEPQSNYFVSRIAREWNGGERQVGVLITDVRRSLDAATAPFLRRSGTAVMAQFVQRFLDNTYEAMVYEGRSYAYGSPSAIAMTQQNSVHLYQRPDFAEDHYDSTRTALFGGATGLSFRRIRGALQFETFLRHSLPGQEMNDFGYVPYVNDQMIRHTMSFSQLKPGRWFRSGSTSMQVESHWTVSGLPSGKAGYVQASRTLQNNWNGIATVQVTDVGGGSCFSCARGGPGLRQEPRYTARLDINGDPRPSLQPAAAWIVNRGDGGRSGYTEFDLAANARIGTRFSASVVGAYNIGVNDQQWVANYGALRSDTTHYTFARLDQRTLAVVTRLNWTASPDLSFQFYGQPFITTGAYTHWRQLAAPGAPTYDARFRPYGAGANPNGFSVKQFNSNTVIRWEFRPASALFLVWQQGRQDGRDPGTFEAGRDFSNLFATAPQNTLLLKLSYWFNP